MLEINAVNVVNSICELKNIIAGSSPSPSLNIKGIIFDLDDTLYSEKEYVKSGFKEVAKYLSKINVNIHTNINTNLDTADARHYEKLLWSFFEDRKPAIDTLIFLLWEKTGTTTGTTQEKLEVIKAECLKIYRTQENPDIHLYTGVKDMLSSFKEIGFKLGIITDGRPEGQRNKIKALSLEKLIDDIIITDELGGIQFRKPCDIAFRIIQRRWKFPASQIVYIGDNMSKDFQAPIQLGMKAVHFKNNDGLYSSTL